MHTRKSEAIFNKCVEKKIKLDNKEIEIVEEYISLRVSRTDEEMNVEVKRKTLSG